MKINWCIVSGVTANSKRKEFSDLEAVREFARNNVQPRCPSYWIVEVLSTPKRYAIALMNDYVSVMTGQS